MGLKSAGLGLHFLLELAAMAALVTWGFQVGTTWWQKLLLGILLPITAAATWGIFRFPNDPSTAIVSIAGPLRLLLEWVILFGAAAALFNARYITLGWIMVVLIVVDYLIMADRVLRLVGVK